MAGFSDLPESIQVLVRSDKPGHLFVEPKSDRIKAIIAETNTKGCHSLVLECDGEIEEFLTLLRESAQLRDFSKTSTVLVNTVPYVQLVIEIAAQPADNRVDFSKLPKNIFVTIQKNQQGHLEVRPKSHGYDHIIPKVTVKGDRSFCIQDDYNVRCFIKEFIPPSKRKTLNEGQDVVIRLPFPRYLVHLGEPSDAYIEYVWKEEWKSEFEEQQLPNLFAQIEGIPIYHVHKDYGEGRELDFWYSTVQCPEDLHEEYKFRVDELDPTCHVERVGDEPPIESWNRFIEHCKRAIAQGLRENKIKLPPPPGAAVLGGNDRNPEPGSVVLGGNR
jgi:hypothetical protein